MPDHFPERRLLKKCRQFQQRGPDSPGQWNADDKPVKEKFAPVSGGLGLVRHTIGLRFPFLLVNIVTLIHRTHGKVAN